MIIYNKLQGSFRPRGFVYAFLSLSDRLNAKTYYLILFIDILFRKVFCKCHFHLGFFIFQNLNLTYELNVGRQLY